MRKVEVSKNLIGGLILSLGVFGFVSGVVAETNSDELFATIRRSKPSTVEDTAGEYAWLLKEGKRDFPEAARIVRELDLKKANEGLAAYNEKNYSEAASLFNQAIVAGDISDRTLDSDMYAVLKRMRGMSAYLSKDYNLAIRDLQEVKHLFKSDAELLVFLGSAYSATEQHRRAIEELTASIQVQPRAVAFLNRGVSLLKIGDIDSARKDIASAKERYLAIGDIPGYKYAQEVDQRVDTIAALDGVSPAVKAIRTIFLSSTAR